MTRYSAGYEVADPDPDGSTGDVTARAMIHALGDHALHVRGYERLVVGSRAPIDWLLPDVATEVPARPALSPSAT